MATDTTATPWDTCASPGCRGARVAPTGQCVRHLSEEDLVGWLERLGAGGVLDARGVAVDKDLLAKLLDGRTSLPAACSNSATLFQPRVIIKRLNGILIKLSCMPAQTRES